jgi:hypothetical protein
LFAVLGRIVAPSVSIEKEASRTSDEQAFIKSRTLSNGVSVNNYFQDFSKVVHTKASVDKDLYGKPEMVFIHEEGIQGMATDLKKLGTAFLSGITILTAKRIRLLLDEVVATHRKRILIRRKHRKKLQNSDNFLPYDKMK